MPLPTVTIWLPEVQFIEEGLDSLSLFAGFQNDLFPSILQIWPINEFFNIRNSCIFNIFDVFEFIERIIDIHPLSSLASVNLFTLASESFWPYSYSLSLLWFQKLGNWNIPDSYVSCLRPGKLAISLRGLGFILLGNGI